MREEQPAGEACRALRLWMIAVSVILGASCSLIWPFMRDLEGVTLVGLGTVSALCLLALCHLTCRFLRRCGLIPVRG